MTALTAVLCPTLIFPKETSHRLASSSIEMKKTRHFWTLYIELKDFLLAILLVFTMKIGAIIKLRYAVVYASVHNDKCNTRVFFHLQVVKVMKRTVPKCVSNFSLNYVHDLSTFPFKLWTQMKDTLNRC